MVLLGRKESWKSSYMGLDICDEKLKSLSAEALVIFSRSAK